MNNRYSWPVKLVCGGLLAVVLSVCYFGVCDSQAAAKSGSLKERDVMPGAVFRVEVEGRWSGTFKTCSGIGSAHEVFEQKLASDKGREIVKKVPARLRWHDVTLARGLTGDTKLWSWREEVVVGKIEGARQKCTITMMNRDGKPVAVWELANSWPTNLKIGTSADNDAVIEEVTITHEGVTRRP